MKVYCLKNNSVPIKIIYNAPNTLATRAHVTKIVPTKHISLQAAEYSEEHNKNFILFETHFLCYIILIESILFSLIIIF